MTISLFIVCVLVVGLVFCIFFFQAEDGIRDLVRSRGLGDVYKRQAVGLLGPQSPAEFTINRSGPYISMISAARCGVHLLSLIHI